MENVRYTNTRQLYAYGEFCDHLQEKSPAEFLKDGEHAVPEDLWISRSFAALNTVGMEPPAFAAAKASGSPSKFSISGFSKVICDRLQKSRRSPARYSRSG